MNNRDWRRKQTPNTALVASRAPRGHDEAEKADGFPEPEGTSHLYTIREMARYFQVSIRTLRFYEDRGLLHPLPMA